MPISLRLCLSLILGSLSLLAQGRGIIPNQSSFFRAWVICPMTGSGSWDNPIRPMFVPAQGFRQNLPSVIATKAPPRTGILSYSYQTSDDGKSALVEFVSIDRAGLREILESRTAGVAVFELGRNTRAEIETAFKAKKAGFDFAKFGNKVH